MSTPPRLAPARALPPYAYVPGGGRPHPQRDPDGHSYGRGDAAFGPPPAEDGWCQHEGWLYALDLFNHGYYWEAHEGLEKWWRETAVGDPRRSLFQGLLRLAAAGVKAREQRPAGVRKHALRAAELLAAAGSGRLLGLDPIRLRRAAAATAARLRPAAGEPDAGAEPALDIVLDPRPSG